MYKNDIGNNAGTIWHLLADNIAMSIREIGEHSNYREAFLMLALWWLARENKIRFFEKHEVLYIELNNYPVSEMYF